MYRFNSPRKLSKLLVKGEGGCSKLHPGIGDVAYVKDLRNNQIVSKTFQCSRFGSHIVNGLGWVNKLLVLKIIQHVDIKRERKVIVKRITTQLPYASK